MEESFPMTGGDGPCSYAKNSNPQKVLAEKLKATLVSAILENHEVQQLTPPSTPFRIVDLGCSTGPNTIMAMNSIVETVIAKYQKEVTVNLPEFQVFFNDHVSNDFNTLFMSLPSDRQYFAAAVPGSFHGRLFPKATLNFVYSSSALHWLSKVPPPVRDFSSSAFNRGRILYSNAPSEVGMAYAAHYAKDMESFLSARAEELVPGGLMALMFPGRPDGTLPAEASIGPLLKPLESSLVDMANKGILSRDKLDSFNLPIYSPSPEEVRLLVQKNGCFTITKLNLLPESRKFVPFSTMQECRAGLENIIRKHFGGDIIDDLFDRYAQKVVELQPSTAAECVVRPLVLLLKRNEQVELL